ncbi:hypothetical protein AAMO2058_001456300 [Amorphochlora amoebiformis]
MLLEVLSCYNLNIGFGDDKLKTFSFVLWIPIARAIALRPAGMDRDAPRYRTYAKLHARWTHLKYPSGAPAPRCGHTLNHLSMGPSGSLLVAFGESSKLKKRDFFRDARILNLDTKTWTTLPSSPFAPRGDHTANSIQNNVFFFGGRWMQSLLGDAFFLSGLGSSNLRWVPTHSDPTPGSRRGHTMTSIPRRNGMVLFGGLRGNIFLNDLWIFDIQTERWFEKKFSNTDSRVPSPRCFHTAFTDKSQHNLFVLGGSCGDSKQSVIYRHDLRTTEWDVVKCRDMPPCIGHTSHLLPNQDLLLYGTHHSDDRNSSAIPSKDCHVLGRTSKTSPIECALLGTTGEVPQARQHHASVLVGPKLYIFGGWKPGMGSASNALYCLEVESKPPPTPRRTGPESGTQQLNALGGGIRAKGAKVTLSLTPVKARKMRVRPEPVQVGRNAMKRTQMLNPQLLPTQDKTAHDQTFTLKVINYLLSEWAPPTRATFFLAPKALLSLCDQVLPHISRERTLVEMKAPCKVFGDIHGQFFDLLEFFAAFGSPDHISGDIKVFNYLFLGDYVDRGMYSLEVITLLLALKLQYGSRITLLRGNHEASDTNMAYGFQDECRERLGPDGERVWKAFNTVFKHLPLGAVIEGRILCIHGGIGRVQTLEQIRRIKRPIDVRLHSTQPQDQKVTDLLWSDPTQGDGEKGVSPNEDRGVASLFGPDVVMRFCARNNIDLVVRAHQVVMDGYEYFANGHLITVFSATNYCGRLKNNGAMLEINQELLVTPKFIERPLAEEPQITSRGTRRENSSENVTGTGSQTNKRRGNHHSSPGVLLIENDRPHRFAACPHQISNSKPIVNILLNQKDMPTPTPQDSFFQLSPLSLSLCSLTHSGSDRSLALSLFSPLILSTQTPLTCLEASRHLNSQSWAMLLNSSFFLFS